MTTGKFIDHPMQRQGLIMCVCGPSGVGKGTLISGLLSRVPNVFLSISMTTRQPRGTEKDGVEYYFCDHQEFEERLARKDILEYDIYLGNYYGTPASPIRQRVARGQNVILDITLAGAFQVKNMFPDAIMVFLLPPDMMTLERRLIERGTEAHDVIKQRMIEARREIREAIQFHYVIINDTIQKSVDRLESILIAESCRRERQPNIVEEMLRQDD